MSRRSAKVLVVEGKDELRALPELLERNIGRAWEEPYPVRVDERDGIDAILAPGALSALLKQSGLTHFGVLIDANSDPAGRWTRLTARLREGGCTPPSQPPLSGWSQVMPNGLRVGAWMMPDNQSVGMLESLLLRHFDAKLPELSEHAGVSLGRGCELGATVKPAHIDKARLHTLLAWQDPPGAQVHQAIKYGLIAVDGDEFRPFVDWCRALFEF